ncbi:transglutaminase-like domain-containing protein [Nigerium massiliense]|uniref:transglutaminase-like domain-containing protein n=1 Tax=Nigerium massiliense TaxID=1522317 RepID=UPI00058FCE78|nr:transglutaminase family protein [Nigerium massiliense]
MRRHVESSLSVTVLQSADVVLSLALAGNLPRESESLTVTLDGAPLQVTEIVAEDGLTRLHLIEGIPAGRLEVRYDAVVDGRAEPVPVTPLDRIVYTRPSRYADSDTMAPVAQAQFAGLAGKDLLDAVSSWVGSQLSYVSGSSRPTDGAVQTYLMREGVCRDYAHLCVALLRALNVPARLASVYAPGLNPMDFHAVAEAVVDDRWCSVDATALAPRSTMVRIATGRDAADTSFMTTLSGVANLETMQVGAVVEDGLPGDDVTELAQLR